MADTLDSARAKLAAAGRALSDVDAIAQAYAELVVKEGRRRAAGRPTPQARMAASGVQARQGAIYGSAFTIVSGRGGPVPLGEIVYGSEFGSTLFRQFGPRHSKGAWLYPAGNDDRTVDAIERGYIDQAISRATGGH